MSTYAELNTDNIVINVIVADAEFVATQTDKTYVEYDDNNPAGIGYTYNADADVFIGPQPYASWTLDSNHDWQPPTPMPTDASMENPYEWSEEDLEWVAI
jgi:hypothetical protein